MTLRYLLTKAGLVLTVATLTACVGTGHERQHIPEPSPQHAAVSDEQLQGWCASASLKCSELRHIEGQTFNVVLCIAQPSRPRAAGTVTVA